MHAVAGSRCPPYDSANSNTLTTTHQAGHNQSPFDLATAIRRQYAPPPSRSPTPDSQNSRQHLSSHAVSRACPVTNTTPRSHAPAASAQKLRPALGPDDYQGLVQHRTPQPTTAAQLQLFGKDSRHQPPPPEKTHHRRRAKYDRNHPTRRHKPDRRCLAPASTACSKNPPSIALPMTTLWTPMTWPDAGLRNLPRPGIRSTSPHKTAAAPLPSYPAKTTSQSPTNTGASRPKPQRHHCRHTLRKPLHGRRPTPAQTALHATCGPDGYPGQPAPERSAVTAIASPSAGCQHWSQHLWSHAEHGHQSRLTCYWSQDAPASPSTRLTPLPHHALRHASRCPSRRPAATMQLRRDHAQHLEQPTQHHADAGKIRLLKPYAD